MTWAFLVVMLGAAQVSPETPPAPAAAAPAPATPSAPAAAAESGPAVKVPAWLVQGALVAVCSVLGLAAVPVAALPVAGGVWLNINFASRLDPAVWALGSMGAAALLWVLFMLPVAAALGGAEIGLERLGWFS